MAHTWENISPIKANMPTLPTYSFNTGSIPATNNGLVNLPQSRNNDSDMYNRITDLMYRNNTEFRNAYEAQLAGYRDMLDKMSSQFTDYVTKSSQRTPTYSSPSTASGEYNYKYGIGGDSPNAFGAAPYAEGYSIKSDGKQRSIGFKLPAEHMTHLLSESKRLGVDPNLVLSVLATESYGNHQTVSGAGAQGYMQVMPSVATDFNKRYGTSYDINNPLHNITMGINELSNHLKTWKGDVPLALASYNAGPARVKAWVEGRDWIKKDSNGNVIARFKTLPKETQDYITKVYSYGGLF